MPDWLPARETHAKAIKQLASCRWAKQCVFRNQRSGDIFLHKCNVCFEEKVIHCAWIKRKAFLKYSSHGPISIKYELNYILHASDRDSIEALGLRLAKALLHAAVALRCLEGHRFCSDQFGPFLVQPLASNDLKS